MRTQSEVEFVVRRAYERTGGDPSDLVGIKPIDGGPGDGRWANALSYEITRSDGKHTRVYRSDLDDENEYRIAEDLRSFK